MKQVSLTPAEGELHQAAWAPAPVGAFPVPTISYTPVATNEKPPVTSM